MVCVRQDLVICFFCVWWAVLAGVRQPGEEGVNLLGPHQSRGSLVFPRKIV